MTRDHKKERKHSDGYKKSQTLNIQVAEGIEALANDTLPLHSDEAPRTDLDPYIKISCPTLFNGAMQTVYSNFRQVDYQAQIAAADQTPESTTCDYITAQINIPMAYGLLYPGLSNISMQGDDYNPENFTNNWPCYHDGYYSLITPEVNVINDQFNKLVALFNANLSYGTAPLMSSVVYALNDWSPLATNGTWGGVPQVGSLSPVFAVHAAVQQSMLYLVTRLKLWAVDRYLLKYFANKHTAFAPYLMQVQASMQSLRYRALLDRAADILRTIPCDVDLIDNYSRRILPSRTGSSWYDPILIPTMTIACPTYQVQPGPNQATFTLWPCNQNWRSEYSINTYYARYLTTDNMGERPVYANVTDADENEFNIYFINQDTRTEGLESRVIPLMQAMEHIAQTTQAAQWPVNFQNQINEYLNALLADLQQLVNYCSTLLAMSTTYIGFWQLADRSHLTNLKLHDWQWDYDISFHYDGFIWDWVKHPEIHVEAVEQQINNEVQQFTINNAQQYTAYIAIQNDTYDGHLVDGISMYNITSEAFFDQNNDNMQGNIIWMTPFHLEIGDYEILTNTPTAQQIANMYEQPLYKMPIALIYDYIDVYNYVNDEYVYNINDIDENGDQTYYNGQFAYWQQYWILPNGEINNTPMTVSRYLGIVGYQDNDDPIAYLYTSNYTAMVPVTVANPTLRLQEWVLNHLPFVTTLKTDAQKVLQVIS